MKRGSRTLRVYTTPNCVRCEQLKRWLKNNGIDFEEMDLSSTEVQAELIMKDVYSTSSPILQIEKSFILAKELFEGERLNEKLLLSALKKIGR
ncbi:MAG: glutaredoxin domain-containing protein [Thermoproteota archaeon]